jgi:hypothetical protein
MKDLYRQFQEFFPWYLREHDNRVNILLHFTGATIVISSIILSFIAAFPLLLIPGVFMGYFLPHIGHKFFQKNHSMRASHPVFCVIGAFLLYLITWKNVLVKIKIAFIKG